MIKYKKYKKIDFTYYNQYNKLRLNLRKMNLNDWNTFRINNQYYSNQLFDINLNESYCLRSTEINKNFILYKLSEDGMKLTMIGKTNDIQNKVDIIVSNMLGDNIFNKIRKYKYCEREKLLYSHRLYNLYYLFDLLNKNGKFVITLYGYCDKAIEILYLLTLMFDYIYIFNNSEIFCYNFNSIISKKDVKKLINNNLSIEPKYQLNNLLKYFETNIKYQVTLLKLQNDCYDDKYSILTLEDLIIMFYYINPYQKNDIFRYILFYFNKIYYDNLLLCKNKVFKYIFFIINKFNCKNCLEVGMGFGLYSFIILCNKNANLTSIDLDQKKFFNYGIKLLKKFKFDDRHILIKNEINNKKFDFIFIDFFYNQDINLENYDKLLDRSGIIFLYNYNSSIPKIFKNYKKMYNNNIKNEFKIYNNRIYNNKILILQK